MHLSAFMGLADYDGAKVSGHFYDKQRDQHHRNQRCDKQPSLQPLRSYDFSCRWLGETTYLR